MNELKIKNVFAAVSNKSVLDPLLKVLDKNSVRFWGTQGTVDYLKKKKFSATSVVSGFDFDGRIKTLDRKVFARILANRSKIKHLEELKNVIARSQATKQSKDRHVPRSGTRDDNYGVWQPFDLVIVDLYPLDKKNFPESMDIGGQALIRAAIKNYENVAVAFDKSSLESLVSELVRNKNSTTLAFRKKQAKKAAEFIAERCKLEANDLK